MIPARVMALEVRTEPVSTPVWKVKLKLFGVVSSAPVVLLKVPVTPPIVSGVLVVAFGLPAEVCRTHTLWPLPIVPAAVTNVPVQPML